VRVINFHIIIIIIIIFYYGNFLNMKISQCSVATCLRCDGMFNTDFVVKFTSNFINERILKIG